MAGAVLVAIAGGSIVLLGSSHNLATNPVWVSILLPVAIGTAIALVRVERRARTPLIPPLRGWQEQAGREARSVSYWDAIAALNTPTELHGFPGFAEDGTLLDAAAVTERRDEFLGAALGRLAT